MEMSVIGRSAEPNTPDIEEDRARSGRTLSQHQLLPTQDESDEVRAALRDLVKLQKEQQASHLRDIRLFLFTVIALLLCIVLMGVLVYWAETEIKGILEEEVASDDGSPVDINSEITPSPKDPKKVSRRKKTIDDILEPYDKISGMLDIYVPERTATADVVLAEIKRSDMNKMFVVSSIVSKGNARDIVLHESWDPEGPNWFEFREAPNRRSVDLVSQDLEVRKSTTSDYDGDEALDGKWDGWRTSFTPFSWRMDDEGYILSYLIDITSFVKSGFGLDLPPGKARVAKVRGHPRNMEFEVQWSTPDDGSFGVRFSLALVPDTPMTPRAWDSRVGYFNSFYKTISQREPRKNTHRFIHRWRLDKEDPMSALSDPIKPIVYHVDPTVPRKYWGWMVEGIERWNKAFAAAGFSNAIRGVTPDDDDFPADYDAGDIRYNSITWSPAVDNVVAIGPHVVDPRSGEIMNADITFTSGWSKIWIERGNFMGASSGILDDTDPEGQAVLKEYVESFGGNLQNRAQISDEDELVVMSTDATTGTSTVLGRRRTPTKMRGSGHKCDRNERAANTAFGIRTHLISQGLMSADDDLPEEFMKQGLIETVMHEVGHTLGLRHNFKASTATPWEKLQDKSWTEIHGLSSSVMDYIPANTPRDRDNQGEYYTQYPGDYDLFAIKYGYTPLDGEVAEVQHERLAEMASAGAAAGIVFATDEDTPREEGTDPSVNMWDLSSDVLTFYRDQIEYGEDLKSKIKESAVSIGEAYDWVFYQHRSASSLSARGAQYAAKFVGGQVVSKWHRGDLSNDAPVIVPSSKTETARALHLISDVLVKEYLLPRSDYITFLTNRRVWTYGNGEDLAYGLYAFPYQADVFSTRVMILLNIFRKERMVNVVQNMELGKALGIETSTPFDILRTLTDALWGDGAASSLAQDSMGRNLQDFYVWMLLTRANRWVYDFASLSSEEVRYIRKQVLKLAGDSSPEVRAHMNFVLNRIRLKENEGYVFS